MTAADKIAAARKVRRFKLVRGDGWHGMTVRPDGGYISHKDYAALADLADAQAQRIEDVEAALSLALGILIEQEPGDSRAVSDEFVAMAAVQCGVQTDEDRAFIRARLSPTPSPEPTP